jgi:imidazolonepropionase-like amidohydrolase
MLRSMRTVQIVRAALAMAVVMPAAALAAPTVAVKPGVVKRNVIIEKRQSGTSIVTTAADGTITIALDLVENGRGPHFDATLRLGPDGTVTTFKASGHHTFGAKVHEEFAVQNGRARWKSEEESGDQQLAGKAFFIPVSDVFELGGMAVQAAIANGGRLPLLPGGELRVEKIAEQTVHANGQSRHLIDYGVTGFDLVRSHHWINDDGSWFGQVQAGFSFVPDGWESVADTLVTTQEALDRERDAKLATANAHKPPAAGLVYTHGRMLDVERGQWIADASVLVVGDKIAAAGPAASVKVPAGAEVIDLHGKALLPGLWDMHAHLGDADGLLDIASGVTTVRDVGNDPDKLDDYKKRFDNGVAIGPHVFRFGFIEGRNPKAASSKVTAETEAEAKAGVEFYAKRHYDGMKIYNSVRPELVPIIAREAHARGMAVTGHIPVHMLANEAVRAGYDGIEHINMLYLNFFATHDTDTRDTTRFTLVGDKAAAFDLAGKPMHDFVQLLKEHHTVIDPTIDAFEDLLVGQSGVITPGLEATVARLPLQNQRGFRSGGLPLGDKRQLYHDSFGKLLALFKLLADEHVTLVAGTDALAGLFLHHELALFVRAGVTPAAALRMATLEPARVMHQEARSGSIAAGKNADLVVVDGDPLVNIADVGKVVSTMRGGVVFASPPLYEALGVRPLQ